MVIGVDGATWGEIIPLVDRGEMPNLSRLVTNGSVASLRTLIPTISPRIWTSIATGVVPERHGIEGFFVEAGAPDHVLPITGRSRKAYALWETLGKAGRRVAIIGWYATWPAERVNGVMISDHDNLEASWRDQLAEDLILTTMKRDERGRVISAETKRLYLDEPSLLKLRAKGRLAEPQGIEARVRGDYKRVSQIGPEDLARFGPVKGDTLAKALSHYKVKGHLLSVTANGYVTDMNRTRMAVALWQQEKPDFLAVYLPGLDGVEHYGWKYLHPEGFPVQREELEQYRSFIPAYYRYVDELLGKLLQGVDSRTIVIVLSDHGHMAELPEFRAASVGPTLRSGQHVDGPPGILVLSGGPIKEHHDISKASVLDIAPTVSYLLGAPVAEDLDGKVLADALHESYLRHHPIRLVPSYGVRGVSKPIPSHVDEAYADQLRALGYIR